jgi:hypothetical protein
VSYLFLVAVLLPFLPPSLLLRLQGHALQHCDHSIGVLPVFLSALAPEGGGEGGKEGGREGGREGRKEGGREGGREGCRAEGH